MLNKPKEVPVFWWLNTSFKFDKCGKTKFKHDTIFRKLSNAQEKVRGMLKAEVIKWLFVSALLRLGFNWGISVWTTIQNVTELFEATSTSLELWKYRNFTYPVFCPFLNHWKKCLDCGASLSRPVRFDLCPTNASVTVSFGQRHQWTMLVSTVLTLDRMDTNKLKISMRNMSFLNFNSGLQYDLATHELN